MILVDALMAYPFVDESTNDVQPTNATTTIPRYTDGAGVQVYAVSVAPPSGAGVATFNFSYTNSDGVSGRTSQTVTLNTSTVNGEIVGSAAALPGCSTNPFIPLQTGDSGVRSIESVQMVSGTDLGLFTLVLCRPLLDTQICGVDAPVEQIPYIYKSEIAEIKSDACLGLLCCPQGAFVSARIMGSADFIWT